MVRLLVMGDARSVHTERWCRYFEQAGFDVALFSLEPNTITTEAKFFPGKRPTGMGVIDYFLAKPRFRKVLDQFRPDLVNAHFVVSYGWLASYCRVCPVVTTAWGSDLLLLPQSSALHRVRIKRALRHAAYCTVDNQNLHDVAAQYVGPEKIFRAVMGVEREVFETTGKSVFPPEGRLRIIAPRGLRRVYDPETILSAAQLLKGKIDFHIDLIGKNPEAKTYGEEIAARSLSDFITIVPPLPHSEYVTTLKQYDVYLSASLSDSTSVALLEAMAVGAIPVVSDIEGNREWVTGGISGFAFKPGSASSLADAIITAAGRRRDFPAIAAGNRQKVQTDAIWEDNMERVKNLFLRLAGK
jgi:L-malate glycosyltransferase